MPGEGIDHNFKWMVGINFIEMTFEQQFEEDPAEIFSTYRILCFCAFPRPLAAPGD